MGDFNSEICEEEMQNFMNINNLIDLIADKMSAPPATYSCGHKRLDFILG